MLLEEIEKQIDNINQSIEWIRRNKPESFDQRFISLVEERRKLKILANAERNNPSVAAFGQSQVGKSYLMNCILQNGGSPFMVEASDREHNFVDEINPIGEGQEATGVVTRFSSYKRNKSEYSLEYPIRMRVLSLKDMINIISDTYFNEFDDYTTLSESETNEVCDGLRQKYANAEMQHFPILKADDMLDIKYYFKKHINNAQTYSTKTPFFDTLALIIDRVPLEDYVGIFSRLWNSEPEYIKLFQHSINILQRLKFEEHVYLPIEAVTHGGKKEDTIMSVSCLKLLFTDIERTYTTSAYHRPHDNFVPLGDFTKSELCMVCSEVVIKIREQYISTCGSFDTRMMSDSSREKLPSGSVSVEVLRDTDLLDFPGARARGNMLLDKINDHDNLMYTFLRGKVAYLFNKYNEEKNINILLFCHHHKNVETPQMWQLLDEWVKEYVGPTAVERKRYIDNLGVPPLFHVGTMFNLNLQNPDNETVGKTEESISSRWSGRFKLLIEECFKNTPWVSEWVSEGNGRTKPFQNCYMLRDFKFSTNIYSGWKEEKREAELVIEQEYYRRMRTLFISNSEVNQLFDDAELAWDVAATSNNDGALYILCQLARVSSKIDEARETQIESQLKICCNNVHAIMKEYHQTTDEGEILKENISKSYAILREMDFTCNVDNYYFGHLVQALQLTEKEAYGIVHEILAGSQLNDVVHSFHEYEIIRGRCRTAGYPLEQVEDENEKWERFIRVYHFDSRTDAEQYLTRRDIDVEKLFSGSYIKKLNSHVVAEQVFRKWCSMIKSVDFLNEFSSESGFDSLVMSNLVDEYVHVAEWQRIVERMANEISEYVDVTDVHTISENLVADILATFINNFVLDFGYGFLPDDARENAKEIFKGSDELRLRSIDTSLPTIANEEDLTTMFGRMTTESNALLPSFEDNYNKWLEYMRISFVAHLNVPDFDEEANRELETILEQTQLAQ